MLPAENALAKLKTLKTLALGSMVTRSLTLIGQETLMSIVFSQGVATAWLATESSVGMTQPSEARSVAVITWVLEIRPGQRLWLPTRHSPAGVSDAAKVWL